MRNIKLLLEYDGSEFCGWQLQTDLRTVQGELEKALSHITSEDIRVVAAGRTDTGVHALGQVVNFKTNSLLKDYVFKLGVNALLPRDIRINHACEVAPDFNARFSARSRHYKFFITTRPVAIGRQYIWYVKEELDIVKMQNACRLIVGSHDFKSFCHAGAEINHYLCDVYSADWSLDNDKLVFEIKANRFLHNMVRILVGTMIKIGNGSISITEFQNILDSKNRIFAGPTAPPQGLFLIKVGYETDEI